VKLDELRRLTAAAGEAVVPEGGARYTVTVGMGTCGIAAGAREVLAALVEELASRDVNDVIVSQCGCRGLCAREPLVVVTAAAGEETVYADMTPARVREVVAAHLVAGAPLEAYILRADGP
jgi:NADP-reducing hydrogenase subunit HndB